MTPELYSAGAHQNYFTGYSLMEPTAEGTDSGQGSALTQAIAALKRDERDPELWHSFWLCVGQTGPALNDPRFLHTVAKALRLDGMDHIHAEREAQYLVAAILHRVEASGEQLSRWALHPPPADVAARDLLLALLECGVTTHRDLEVALVKLRGELLELARGGVNGPERGDFLKLAAALAVHCFNQEYVFAESASETRVIANLQTVLVAGAAYDSAAIAMVAAYRPLNREPYAPELSRGVPLAETAALAKLLLQQVSNAVTERLLRAQIPQLTPIADATSRDVRAQYEENPYPRWHYLPAPRPKAGPPTGAQASKILVPGCGTGRHPLVLAALSPESEVWAVDLSLTSLAYAKRMAGVYGIRNIKFFQGDILELGALTERFSFISCEGVLHHLRVPEAGLAVLRTLLTEGGNLGLAVYTQSGAQSIAAGIALRQDLNLGSSLLEIRQFREAVFALPARAPAAGLAAYRDFFFTSECRDLVFHVQDHRYTLPQLAKLFARTGLAVVNLAYPDYAKARFLAKFPDADPATDLEKWAEIENTQLGLFGPMYKIILQKVITPPK